MGILAGCSKIGWVKQFWPVPEGSSVEPENQAPAGQKAHLACLLLLPAQPASSRLRQRARRTDHYNLASRISRIAEVLNRFAPGGANRGNSYVYNTSMARWAGVIAENIARALGLRRSGRDFVGACPSCGCRTGFSVTEKDSHLLVYCAAGGAGPLARTGQVGLVHDRDDRRTLKRRRRAGQVEKAARRHWLRLAPRAALRAVKNVE